MNSIGRVTLDIKPGPGNPRNSEGAFHTLEDGSILFAYSKFIGNSGNDEAYSCIACRISGDGGDTWSDDRILFRPEDHGALNVMSVSFLPMADGAVGLFYCVKYGLHDTRLHLRRSYDGGLTWGQASVCIPAAGYFVTNNDRLVRLSSGRILLPANFHRMAGSDSLDWRRVDLRALPCMFYSDDDGATWREAPGSCFVTLPHSATGLQESGAVELAGGIVWQWMRTDMGCQYESFSADGGETWTVPAPSAFTSPCSPMSIKRAPDGRLLAVWNPVPHHNGLGESTYSGRTPLALAVSRDDGRTWSKPAVLEDDPRLYYCYTAIHFAGKSVLLAYCAGDRLVIRKAPVDGLPR